eukprot:7000062-Prymnesium_polylepis.1
MEDEAGAALLPAVADLLLEQVLLVRVPVRARRPLCADACRTRSAPALPGVRRRGAGGFRRAWRPAQRRGQRRARADDAARDAAP